MISRSPNTAHGRGSPIAATEPDWYTAANVNEWVALPGSTLTTSGVGWSGTNPGGTGGYSTVVTAWSGGVLNTVGCYYGGAFHAGTFMVLFGGGHGDYAGNELYAYGPLEDDSPAWHRLTDPTIPAPNNVSRLGGYPVSRHTYDTLFYLPTLNKMLCMGVASNYSAGNTFNVGDLFDFAADPGSVNPWTTNDTSFPAFNGGGVGVYDLVGGYNPTTGKAWGIGKGNSQMLGVFDASSETWLGYSKNNPNATSRSKGAVDATHNILVFMGLSGVVYAQDLASPTSSIYAPTCTGTSPGAGDNVLEWDSVAGRFVAWDRTGKTLYFLTPGANPASGGDSWTWASTTPAGGATPAAAHANGTYGRFRVNNGTLRGVVLMPLHNQPICFYKF